MQDDQASVPASSEPGRRPRGGVLQRLIDAPVIMGWKRVSAPPGGDRPPAPPTASAPPARPAHPPMPLRRKITMAAVALVLTGLGYSAFWAGAMVKARSSLLSWIEARRAQGYTIAWGDLSFGGFPLAIRVRATELDVTAPGGTWEWQTPAVVVWVRPWAPSRLFADPGPAQKIAYGPPAARHDVEAATPHALFALRLRAWQRVEAASLQLAAADIREDGRERARIGRLSIQATRLAATAVSPRDPNLPATARLTVSGGAIVLPENHGRPLGDTLSTIEATATVHGALTPGPLNPALEAWRQAGGTVDLDGCRLDWGPLDMDVAGSFALDESLRPMGAATAHVAGYLPAVDALVNAGAMRPRDGALAKVVLGMLARRDDADGSPRLAVPVTMQGGKLFVGPVALADLPALP